MLAAQWEQVMEKHQMSEGQFQALFFIVPIGGLIALYAVSYYLEYKKGFSRTKSRLIAAAAVFGVIIVIALVLRLIYGKQTGFVV